MKNLIALMPVSHYDRRTDAEWVHNTILTDEFKEKYPYATILDLSEFMDLCNDQEIDLEEYWITFLLSNS